MLINEHTALHTDRLFLVPYSKYHVPTYHNWMQDPDIQNATASEPLNLDEEYAMQQSWRSDADKLTFILCLPYPNNEGFSGQMAEIASMIGDVNMFVSLQEDDDSSVCLIGELEIMVAVKDHQRRGLGRCALLSFISYILRHEEEIIAQFSANVRSKTDRRRFDYLAVKVGEANQRSISLFEGIGFGKTTGRPNYFGEFELRHYKMTTAFLEGLLSTHGVLNYREVEY